MKVTITIQIQVNINIFSMFLQVKFTLIWRKSFHALLKSSIFPMNIQARKRAEERSV